MLPVEELVKQRNWQSRIQSLVLFGDVAALLQERTKQRARRKSQHIERFSSSIYSRLLPHGFVPYRITLSALASTLGGIVRPICFAAFRLMTNSNLVACCTGKSAGLAPFNILST